MRPLNRYAPALPVQHMQTYRIASPVGTHTRPATCAEVGCTPYLQGWVTVVPASSPDPKAYTADYVRAVAAGRVDHIRRHCTERAAEGGLVEFHFPAGQRCFSESKHRKSLDRPEIYLVRGGDWRGNTGLIRRHTRPEHWVEDMQTTLDKAGRRA